MTIAISILLTLVLLVAGFYWAAAAFINIFVAGKRVSGYGSTSAVLGLATMAGIPTVLISILWFQWIESPAWMGVAVAPDAICALGELVFFIRLNVFGLPDKALPGMEQTKPDSAVEG